jgi:predicted AAA+ superfamily ATPase
MTTTILDRADYLQQLVVWVDKPVIKVIIGQRRVGKSMFIFQIMNYIRKNDSKANIIYINTEEEKYQHVRDCVTLQNEVNVLLSPTCRNYLFIDEIQNVAKFEEALKSYLSEKKCDIYCTSRNLQVISDDLTIALNGKIVEFKIHPLSFSEFCLFHNLPKNNETLFKYFRFGGMPSLRNISLEDSIVNEYLQGMCNTILLCDIVERCETRNMHLLRQLLQFIANGEKTSFSSSSISKHLQSIGLHVSPKSILDYADYLRNALIINQVDRYDMANKKILASGGKMYFEDFGLRNAIVAGGFKMADIQRVLENAVYMHLIRQNYKITTGQLRHREIDFIVERDGQKCYIQVAYKLDSQEIVDCKLGNLLFIKDDFPKIIVTMDDFADHDYMGIKHIHILDFLRQLFQMPVIV